MPWFANLHWPSGPTKTVTLVDGVNVDDLAELFSEAAPGAVVRVPTRMNDQIRESPTYLRPSDLAWWQFFHHDAEVVQ